ncbi:MAG: hypothetical protein QOD56_1953, partial [Gammaproteobacteria bacterium]|nr:hypothetical protein [Gammaproteobacteria bacterium]
MALGTRIALTFLLLLAAVLAAALGAVSAANRGNAHREVQRQLDVGESVFSSFLQNNSRLLTQAAQAVAGDYGFREAVAQRDTATLVSVLQNHGERIGAAMVVLTSLDGRVIAVWGSNVGAGTVFPIAPLQREAGKGTNVIVDSGRIYQLVAVPVKTPLPVAWIAMGFELDEKAARQLAEITHLGVTLSTYSASWNDVASTVRRGTLESSDTVTRQIGVPSLNAVKVVATLSQSIADASASFAHLTSTLFVIAGISLVGFASAAFWIARNITRPLHDLTLSVDQIRGGTYDGVLNVQRRDELGVLAEGLQLMQRAVNSRDQAIRRLAYQDSLTGLMNRTAFNAALGEALNGARDATVAIAVINLNRFRRINEHLGYSVGDEVLNKI